MENTLIFAIGFGAAIGTTAAWFPQLVRTWKTQSARDFSWGYLALFITGVFLWTLYGLIRRDIVRTSCVAPIPGRRSGEAEG